ncbi:MAG: hypothetical protein CL933_24635 [Deltaproteobacteria bacterium]|nr:hypothetical protein [Deltaproteobacteria bacterium]
MPSLPLDHDISFRERDRIHGDAPPAFRNSIPLLCLIVGVACMLDGSAAAADRPAGERCADYDAERNVYWGDLHVHTSYSMDAYIFDTRLDPEDAYRFARGEARMLPPLDEEGRGTIPFQIGRPLDFAAVTDHADAFGGVRLCTDPESDAYSTELCKNYRRPFNPASVGAGTKDIVGRVASLNSAPLCGADGALCRAGLIDTWKDLQRAAAKFDDDAPSCRFTTFVAYEHTATPNLTKVHRNVIFRNDKVIEKPITFSDQPSGLGLWQELDRQCLSGVEGCDVLAIPHNPNLSNGRLFTIEYPEHSTRQEQARLASLRARMEPVVEIMQIKGESECRSGMWKVLGADEDCDFEKFRQLHEVEDCQDGMGWGALGGKGCRSRLDFARYALIEGMREADRIGVNPYGFGMIAATDIHAGTPGPTEEWETQTFDARVPGPGYNLGGLAAVWAEENSRESIFQALRRREVYGTSGPRMTIRLFGGWDYPKDLCDSDALVSEGYAGGVPMGSDLPIRTRGAEAPVFVVSAMRDSGTAKHPGNLLQRVQIVKGWADPDGTFHQQVVDVAGSKENGASVDPKTCEVSGPGENQLCSVWRDPDFDANQRAVYYARVFENPSCRFSTRICNAGAPGQKPAGCGNPDIPLTIQDRAWTSPIWYTP